MLSIDTRLNHQPGYLLLQDGTRIELAFLPNPARGTVGCYARAELSESFLERIKAAQALSYGKDDRTGRSLSIPLPRCGFAEAFASRRVYDSARDEAQHQMMLYLAPCLTAFIDGDDTLVFQD